MDRRWVYAGLAVAGGVGLVKLLHRGPRVVSGQTRLLVVGDSLAVGLSPFLKCLATEQRVPFMATAKVGTRIDQWAQSSTLDAALASFQPTLALVSLGTNDSYMMGAPAARQKPWLDRLLGKLTAAGAEVAWIGPPTLPKLSTGTPDPALVGMLEATIPSSHWFASNTLAIPRGPDTLHPTARGYAGWAGAVWHWLSGPPGTGSCTPAS